MVQREKMKPKEIIKEVEVIEKVEEIVEVPRHVYIEEPRTIIRPKYVKVSIPPILIISFYITTEIP